MRSGLTPLVSYPLNGDFGQFKQHLNQNCSGDWIFQLDADEDLEPTLIENLHTILEGNPEIDMFWLPRINIVNGLTPEEANYFLCELAKSPKLVCLEFVEVNPCLDEKTNKMAEVTFDLLEAATAELEK